MLLQLAGCAVLQVIFEGNIIFTIIQAFNWQYLKIYEVIHMNSQLHK